MLATTVAVHNVVNVTCRNGLHGEAARCVEGAAGLMLALIVRRWPCPPLVFTPAIAVLVYDPDTAALIRIWMA
jgi:hypothetical protein